MSDMHVQDGESNDKVHSFVRIQFHHNTQYDARASNPTAVLMKELAFRSTNSTAAQKFVQVRFLTPCSSHASHAWRSVPFNPGGMIQSGIQEIVLTNLQYLY